MPGSSDRPLFEALGTSQRLGMLGRRPIPEVVAHAEAFVEALTAVYGLVVDLGSGGGVPGLVIAWRRPDLRLVLVDRRATRADQLARLVGRLGWTERIAVVTADADVGRDQVRQAALGLGLLGDRPTGPDDAPSLGWADAVVARGFASPATTLRVAAPLLRADAPLIVSEPPEGRAERWSQAVLVELGLARHAHADRRVAVFRLLGGSCST